VVAPTLIAAIGHCLLISPAEACGVARIRGVLRLGTNFYVH